MIEKTLAFLKPDVFANPFACKEIKERIQKKSFSIIQSKVISWSRNDAEQFYKEHHGKEFFFRLTSFMSSGKFEALELERENSIKEWRKLIGKTHSIKARMEFSFLNKALENQSNFQEHKRIQYFKDFGHYVDISEPQKIQEGSFETLRAFYGISDTRNGFHGSDSPESASRELEFIFGNKL